MEKEGERERERERGREGERSQNESITKLVVERALNPNVIVLSEVNVDSTYQPSL